jgi:hypothetical protein
MLLFFLVDLTVALVLCWMWVAPVADERGGRWDRLTKLAFNPMRPDLWGNAGLRAQRTDIRRHEGFT